MNHPATPEQPSLERGAAIAHHLLSWLAPLRFDEASNDEEREAAYRLRYRAVVHEGMDDAARFPDGIERDEFDEDAVHILAWDANEPIATCRLVFRTSGRLLPFEKSFGPMSDTSSRTVEWGRVTVDERLRGDGARIFMGLAARAWLCMRARDYTTAVGVTPERLVRLIRALGFPVEVIGRPEIHWGTERVPILCTGEDAVLALEQMWLAERSDQ